MGARLPLTLRSPDFSLLSRPHPPALLSPSSLHKWVGESGLGVSSTRKSSCWQGPGETPAKEQEEGKSPF